MKELQSTLFLLSNALLWPCLLLLFCAAAYTLFALGAFVREWIDRRRGTPREMVSELMTVAVSEFRSPPGSDEESKAGRGPSTHADDIRASEVALDAFLTKVESRLDRRIGRLVLCSKLGPMLGLAGTLIPLGPALQSLTRDDVESLSGNLMIAFATTVLGLAISAVCLSVSTVRRRWYEGDLAHLEHLATRRLESLEETAA